MSGSTCDSDEDRLALDTPLDERPGLCGDEGSSSDVVSDYCADSEHNPHPSSDSISEPSLSFDRLNVAWQSNDSKAAPRRPAFRTLPSLDRRPADLEVTSSNSLSKCNASRMNGVSSAVSTGLEMGLGLGGVASNGVLQVHNLSSSYASTGNTVTRRHEMLPVQNDGAFAGVMTREGHSDLQRRRTTGGLHAGASPVGKMRIHRTGTQDPHGVHAAVDDSHSSGSNTASSSPMVDYDRTFASMSTPYGTPSHEHNATLSPIIGLDADLSSNDSNVGVRLESYGRTPTDVRNHAMASGAKMIMPDANVPGGLMGVGEVGHFGPGVRAKVTEVLKALAPTLPIAREDGGVVHMIEYGSSKSRSALLFQPVISMVARSSSSQSPSTTSFCITHEDAPPSDFRSTMQLLDSHPESYMDANWQAKHSPSLQNAIFPSFTARPFGARTAPPNTMHLGLSLMDLHWSHAPVASSTSRAAAAESELTAFLRARANEFKKDGVLVMAYIARREQSRSDETPTANAKDIWATLSDVLAPCIQRLVSCGMLKSDLARCLLELPLNPRTASQTRASLSSVKEEWDLTWSYGLEACGGERLPSEPDLLRLPHPAWKAYESRCLSRVAFTEHVIQLSKTLYETHFRATLRDKGRFSKGAVEFVLDSLWDALFSRIVDQPSAIIQNVEIEVCLYALRRR